MQASALTKLSFELDGFHSSKVARPLHIFSVFPRINVEALPNLASEAGVGVTLEELPDAGGVHKIELVSARKVQRAHGYLIDYKKVWTILIQTVESPTIAGNVTESWLRRMYPVVSHSYITSDDLLEIMDELSEIEDSKLDLRSFILRAHDRPGSTKSWNKPYSKEAIIRVIERENMLIEGVNFVFRGGGTHFNARIQTNGHFVFYKGSQYCFSNFQRLVISKFNEVALANHRFFSNRERRIVDGEVEISRLVLNPNRKLTTSDFKSLSSYLGVNHSVSVFHSGNPWLFLNVIDRGDGSSFDIYGYPSEIQIVPFNKASPESLMRLVHNIHELLPLARMNKPL